MKFTADILNQKKNFLAFKKDSDSTYCFYRIYHNQKEYNVTSYFIGSNSATKELRTTDEEYALEILEDCQIIDISFLDLLNSIFTQIRDISNSLLSIIVKDEKLRSIIRHGKYDFQLFCYSAFDSLYSSANILNYQIRDEYVHLINEYYPYGYENSYLPDPPYEIIIYIKKNKNETEVIRENITKELYDCFESSLINSMGIFDMFCNQINIMYINKEENNNKVPFLSGKPLIRRKMKIKKVR